MKKNKRLLYALGNIPEKYIDEAMSEKARQMKNQWKYIITAAACFVIITAVPLCLFKKSLIQNGSNNNGNVTVTEVSEATSENQTSVTTAQQGNFITPQTTCNTSIIETQNNSSVTRPEKPADYAPDKIHSYIIHVGQEFDFKDGYFVVQFLKDKAFQDTINADIKEAADSLKPYFNEKYVTDIRYGDDSPSWENPKNTNGLSILVSCQNGYLSIVMGYLNSESSLMDTNFDYVTTLNYNLFEQKKIEKLSDLFYNHEDILSLINHAVEIYNNDEIFFADPELRKLQKQKFDELTEIPEQFTFESVFLSNISSSSGTLYKINLASNSDTSIYDHMISGKYRSMEEIVDDKYCETFDSQNAEEWTYCNTGYSEQEDNITVYFKKITGSRFHTDEEVNEYSQTYDRMQHIAFEYYKNNYSLEGSPDLFRKFENNYVVFANNFEILRSPYLNNCFTASNTYSQRITIDSKTNKRLNLSEVFGTDWKNSITTVYDGLNPSDITENDFTEWSIQDISDGAAVISAPVNNSWIFFEIPVSKINNDYFNPDYEKEINHEY